MSVQAQFEPQRAESLDATQAELVDLIGARTVGMEECATAIGNLSLFRRDSVTGPQACLIQPSIVVVVQGAKQMLMGNHAYTYDTEHFLINSLDLPAQSLALQASPHKPCLGLSFKLNLSTLAELMSRTRLSPPQSRTPGEASSIGTVSLPLLDALKRLVQLLDEPDDIDVLAPLIEREVHYRLLKSDVAARLWQIASLGSQSQRIARAIDWLKLHFAEPLRIAELADHVQMSTSSLHHYFRELTAMSPLQYQKWLRLSEARHLMLNEALDAASAAFQVGYESPSQFSREYSRLFGASPKRDIGNLRQSESELTAPLSK